MSSEPASTSSRPGPRPRFTREQVLQTALALIDRDGPDAFSMRRLADEMGLGVMTLYGYVANRDEIVRDVTALAFAQLGTDPSLSTDWTERLRADVTQLHDFCRQHPNLVHLILSQAHASPGLFRIRERMLATLADAGFDLPTALPALGILTSYALGFDRLRPGTVPIDLPERIRELPAHEFPHLTAAANHYADHLSPEAFAYGLQLLLRGLRADLGEQERRG